MVKQMYQNGRTLRDEVQARSEHQYVTVLHTLHEGVRTWWATGGGHEAPDHLTNANNLLQIVVSHLDRKVTQQLLDTQLIVESYDAAHKVETMTRWTPVYITTDSVIGGTPLTNRFAGLTIVQTGGSTSTHPKGL